MKINDLFLEKFWAKNEPKPELGSMKNYPQDKDLSRSNVNFETLCFARKFRSIARIFLHFGELSRAWCCFAYKSGSGSIFSWNILVAVKILEKAVLIFVLNDLCIILFFMKK